MSFLFTTFWGALYLVVLLALMAPALFFPGRRILAASMLLLELFDRLSVTFLKPDLALAFLGMCYFVMAICLVFVVHSGKSYLVAFFLCIVSAALIAGSFDVLSWDDTGTIQELFGLFAMLTIIWPNRHGHRVPDGQGEVDRPRGGHRASAGTVAPREADKGHSETHRSS